MDTNVSLPLRRAASKLPATSSPSATKLRVDESRAPQQRDIFAELSQWERNLFLAKCREERFESGERLFAQGDRYSSSFLIRSGIVRSYYVSPGGKEITIAYWSEGALVGGPNVFNEKSLHIWSAAAATPVVTLAIRGRDLEEMAMKIPALSRYLIETLTFKLYWVSVLLQNFGTESVRSRLAHLLLQLAEHYGIESEGETVIRHHFSHEQLALMVGATRSWVSLMLGGLKKEGVLKCRGRDLVIAHKEGLQNIVRSAR